LNGKVISNNRGMWIITQTVNGTVVDSELLEEYISKNVMIEHNGELKTIKEVIQFHCDEYLSKNEIINE
jgi:hypothetical protein